MTDEFAHACFAAGTDCARACLRCADACALDPERSELAGMLRQCFTACVLWLADVYEKNRLRSSSTSRLAVGCFRLAVASETCAIKCERCRNETFSACASDCRRCAKLCRTIARQLADRPGAVISWDAVATMGS
jgi:hypothetical protein